MLLKMLKTNLGILSTTAYDERLTQLIESAKLMIAKEGVTDLSEDNMFDVRGSQRTADHTNAEIYAAYQSGMNVIGINELDGFTYQYPLKVIGEAVAVFVSSIYNTFEGKLIIRQFELVNDTATYYTDTFDPTLA